MKSLILCALFFTQASYAQFTYPVAKKITQVETRFNTVIEDPYKWMENHSDPDLWNWIDEQKELTSNYLDTNLLDVYAARTLEYRKIKSDQTKLTDVKPAGSAPGLEEDLNNGQIEKRFIQWNVQKKNFKSNILKKESATYQIKVTPVASGDLSRVIITQKSDNQLVDILLVKFYTFVNWADDNSFFYVSDLDEKLGGGRPGLYKHKVGDTQSEDQLLLRGKTSTSDLVIHEVGGDFFAEVDGTLSSLQLATGKMTNSRLIDGTIVEMTKSPQATATILNFSKANYGEFYKLRLGDGERRLFLKEQDFVLGKTKFLDENATLVLGFRDGSHVAGILDIFGNIEMINLQDGTIDFVSFKEGILKLGHETYSTPRKIYSYELKNKNLQVVSLQTFPIEIESEKISYTASNGQAASMWVMRKKGVKLTSKTPTILYGYGGFRSSITPSFGIYESLSWMERGGSFAVVTLPGSVDYGESWYQLARVGGRTNAFDSFALAAKELFKRGWTSKDHIGMMGASNGGTLTAGTLQRHCDTFKAAVPLVGVMDLINFTLFTAGKYWTDDYGNPFNESDFKAIYPLSPYHNLEKRNYPAIMVMTAEFDDRVVPMHSYKYLARLQEYNTSDEPILLYNKEWGAHARASGSARESSRFVGAFYTFFSQQLGL